VLLCVLMSAGYGVINNDDDDDDDEDTEVSVLVDMILQVVA